MKKLVLVAALAAGAFAACGGAKQIGYIGASSGIQPNALKIVEVDAETGAIAVRGTLPVANATYIAVNRARTRLYTSLADRSVPKGPNGGVAVYALDPSGCTPVLLEKLATGHPAPCHLSLSPDEKKLVFAEYGRGTAGWVDLKADGTFKKETLKGIVSEDPTGPNKPRQDRPHCHCARVTPDGKYICIVDLGTDRVKIYSAATGAFVRDVITTPAGAGPRHIAFHPNGHFAFLLFELENYVTSYRYADGHFTPIQQLKLTPEDFTAFSKAAAIKLSEDASELYCSNRGHESLAVFSVNAETGTIARRGIIKLDGSFPWDFEVLPGGKVFAVGFQKDGALRTYRYDKAACTLTPLAAVKDMGSVFCTTFLPVSGAAAPIAASGAVDPRVRTVMPPTRIVASSQGLRGTETLCGPRFGQVSEGAFGAGSGPVLKPGEWIVVDFGRELHGSLQIGCGARSGRGARARVRFGESVAEAMSELGERGACNDHAIRDSVIDLPWFGQREIGESGFRFARIDNAGKGNLQLEYVRAVSVMRPMERLGSFRSSDERLNAVFETAVQTVHLCCQSYLWDGIKRDRLVWMGDTHPETMSVLAVFGAADVLPASLDYMAATTPPNKWMNGMPTYTLWWLRNVAEWYRHTGDVNYLKKHAAYISATFDHVLTGMKNDEWTAGTFLDWPTQHNKAAAKAGTQALALVCARETAFMADAIGDASLADKARSLAAKLEKLHPEPCGAKSSAALLALSGLRSPREMFDQELGRDGHDRVSTFYGYYMIEAMSAAGEQRRALDTVRDYWGGMLDVGATSFWEDFNLAWTNNCFRIDELPVAGKKDIHGDYGDFCYKGFRHSLCHGWSSGPAAWCIHRVLGIQPLEPGCTTVRVKPSLGDLAWAEGAYPTPMGPVRVRAEKKADGTIETTINAPEGVKVVRE